MKNFGFALAIGLVVGAVVYLAPFMVFIWTTFSTVTKALGGN